MFSPLCQRLHPQNEIFIPQGNPRRKEHVEIVCPLSLLNALAAHSIRRTSNSKLDFFFNPQVISLTFDLKVQIHASAENDNWKWDRGFYLTSEHLEHF